MAKINTDPRKGVVSYRDKQKANNEPYNIKMSDIAKSMLLPIENTRTSNFNPYVWNSQSSVKEATGSDSLGTSSYDQTSYNNAELTSFETIRANNQPGIMQLTNGLLKGAVLAGTTFLDGTLGLLYGGAKAGITDDSSQLWDNEFSRGMQYLNDLSEEYLPNYYTEAEREDPWYQHFNANFFGDKFIKNLGFTVGAFYSGGLESGAVRALGRGITRGIAGRTLKSFAKNAAKEVAEDGTKALSVADTMKRVKDTLRTGNKVTGMVASGIGSVAAAVNEGRIEALNNSRDWYNLQKQKIEDAVARGELTEEQGAEALAKANEDRAHMGNMDLLFNIPILTMSNLIQFGKLYGLGINNAKKAFNVKGSLGNYKAGTTKWGVAKDIVKGGLSEGTEEISQKAASVSSGNYYETDLNNFIKAKTDPSSSEETLDWVKAISSGINETFNDASSWEEFTIGAMTGILGMPVFRSSRSENGKWRLPITIREGAWNNWREGMEKRKREQEIVDYLNNRFQSKEGKNYYQGLIRNSFYQDKKDKAIAENDDFEYHNANHAQMLSDIMMFDKAGKLEDLVSMINEAYDVSDENLASIVENTTKEAENGKVEGPFVDSEGNPKYSTPEGKQEMIDKITKNRDEIIAQVREYSATKEEIEQQIPNQVSLTDDQLEELVWLKSQIKDWTGRAATMSGEVKSSIRKVIEQLTTLKDIFTRQKTKLGQRGKMRTVERTDSKGNKYTVQEYDASISPEYERAEQNEKAAQQSIDNLSFILEHPDDQLPTALANQEKFTDALIEAIEDLDDSIMPDEEKESTTKKLKDILKIGEATRKYNNKYQEYTKNPKKQLEDHKKIETKTLEEEEKAKQSKFLERFDFTKPAAELATAIDENMEEIENNGGLRNFLKSLNNVQKLKVKAAIKLTKGKNGLKSLLNSKSLTPEQRRILSDFIEEKSIGVNSLEELFSSVKDGIEEGELALKLNDMPSEGISDEAKLSSKEKLEASAKEAFDEDDLAEVLKHTNEMVEALDIDGFMQNAPEEGDDEELNLTGMPKEDDKSIKGEPEGKKKAIKTPTESDTDDNNDSEDDYWDDVDKEYPENPTEPGEPKKENKKTNRNIRNGSYSSDWNLHPQLSEFYLHGLDLQTYLSYIDSNPKAIPEGVDKEKFKTYISETYKYLKEKGAFTYVNTKLTKGKKVEFFIDPELNKKCVNTTVILLRVKDTDTGEYQVIGSLPTELDLQSRTVYYTEGEDGAAVRNVSKKTLGEKNPEVLNLVNSILNEFKSDEENDTSKKESTAPWVSKQSVKVKALMGGHLPLSSSEHTVSDIFGEEIPVIGIYNEERNEISNINSVLLPEKAKGGQVYIGIPTIKGTYIPALAYSTPIKDLSDDDWYFKQIIETIQELVTKPQEIKSISQNLYRLLRIPKLGTALVKREGSKNTKVDSLEEATHLRLSYSNPKNSDRPMISVIPIKEGNIQEEDAIKAIRSLLKLYPKLTTNVDIHKLGNSPEHIEYRKNIAKYLKTNLVLGQTKAINNWFTLTSLEAKKENTAKKAVEKEMEKERKSKDKVGGVRKKETEVTVDGKTYSVNGDEVIKDNGEPASEAENQEVLAKEAESSKPKVASTETEITTALFAGSEIENNQKENKVKKKERALPRGRRLREVSGSDTEIWNQEEELSALEIMLPQLSKEDRIKFVEGLIRVAGSGKKAWGMTENGIITLSDIAASGTLYHEAFHVVFNNILSEAEQKILIKEAKDRFGKNLTDVEAEERLAEEFRRHVQRKGVTKPSLGRRILDFFKSLYLKVKYWSGLGDYSSVLYEDIRSGRYANRTINNSISSRLREEVYTQEMKDILATAHRDAQGRLLAPNGKPSKLTERQYVHVRTKAFKEWFGDWERLAPRTRNDEYFTKPTDATPRLIERINHIIESSDRYGKLASIILGNELIPYNLRYFKVDNNRRDIRSYKKEVPGIAGSWNAVASYIEVLGNNAPEEAINRALLHEIIHYNTEALLEEYKRSPNSIPVEQRKSIEELYNIIEYTKSYLAKDIKKNPSKYKEIRDRQGNPLSTRVFYAFDGHTSEEIDEFVSELFTNPAFQEVLNNIPYKENEKKSVWSKIIDAIVSIFGLDVKQGSVLEAALKESSFFLSKENSLNEIAKNTSKVVDENGEPLVVYHGNRTQDKIEVFDKTKIGSEHKKIIDGFWFITNPSIAKEEYAVIPESIGSGVENLKYGEVLEVFLNIKNPIIESQKGLRVENSPYGPMTLADEDLVDFINRIKENNIDNDGYILTLKDSDSTSDPFYVSKQVQLIVFNPNQIKSATDNVGTYSRSNDDIRYREVEDNLQINPQEVRRVQNHFDSMSRAGALRLVQQFNNLVANENNSLQEYTVFKRSILDITRKEIPKNNFHREFHYIAKTLLTDKEYNDLFSTARRHYRSNLENIAIEEMLAKDFRDFLNGKNLSLFGVLGKAFSQLGNIVKNVSEKTYSLDSIFFNIYNNIPKRTFTEELTSSESTRFEREYLVYRMEKTNYNNLDSETREHMEKASISREDYEELSLEDKERTLHCLL